MLPYIITAVVSIIITALIVWFAAALYQKKSANSKIGNAEEKARGIIDEAVKTAEEKKRESMLEIKEESIKAKNDLDKEIKERRNEISRNERRIVQKEENVDKKLEAIEKREAGFAVKEEELKKQKIEISKLNEQRLQELERISGLTSEQAKEYLLKTIEEDVKLDTAKMIKEMENKAKEEANRKAKDYVVTAIQKCAADHVSETTISVVSLPNDEMKGRIIGREGRNIRTMETLTGVDLIIDDTPEAVVLSSFDPLRREMARLTLETLITDGRVHPTRIEEVYDKVCKETKDKILEYGNSALFELGNTKMAPELIELIGRLHFRTSYGQNALQHSLEVANLAGLMAGEIGEDISLARRAGLLHDIGKAVDHEIEGSHVSIGVELAKKYGENDIVINTILSHHGETDATSVISSLVAVADALSASRPGARNDSLENYVKRLTQLEEVADDIEGVSKVYAMQAGRELRVIVEPDEIDDLEAHKVARDIKEKIESTLNYPGTIKITVVRETRAVEEAK